MSNWPGKYVIGLTGNIATGKSVVRRMLEHLGAYTIDADALSHRAIAKGAPGYQPMLDIFGKWVVGKDGEIDRTKLGNLVFSDSEALAQLESIVHPLVKQAASMLIQRAIQPVIVIEAIKLLESDVRKACDTIWVTTAPEEIQVERLVRKRGFTKEQALERIRIQGTQSDKVAAANMVIHNTGSYDDLWKQISAEWKKISPGGTGDTLPSIKKIELGEFSVQRGRPRDSAVIAEIITRLSKGQQKMKSEDVMAQFGDKAYLLLKFNNNVVGLAGWQVENLVARTTDLYLEDAIDPAKALDALVKEVERASGDLQAEASLLFPSLALATQEATLKVLGYEARTPDTLGVQAWQDAADESMPKDGVMFFKQLRQDRVLRPI
ncbi:MAG: dephospho-CoA kinase [Anaerolineales bacterium]|nr:dephospho-CoA kinase [Anaerolineales bacterium]